MQLECRSQNCVVPAKHWLAGASKTRPPPLTQIRRVADSPMSDLFIEMHLHSLQVGVGSQDSIHFKLG